MLPYLIIIQTYTNMMKQLSHDFIQKVLLTYKGEWIKNLKGANSQFCEFKSKDKEYILRLIEKSRRSKKEILAEIDWIKHLQLSGLNVCHAIQNVDKLLITEWIEGGESYYAVAFKKATGSSIGFNTLPNGFDIIWGRTIAKMHQASENYSPKDNHRATWDGEVLLDILTKQFDTPNHEAIRQMRAANEVLKKLPKKNSNFGLIHSDLSSGNFMISSDFELCIYDFDDSQYAHFIYDFNVILFIALFHKTHQKETFSVHDFYQNFMSGYNEVRKMDKQCVDALPYFLTFFNGLIYAALQKQEITDDNQPLFDFVSNNIETGFTNNQYR